MMANEQGPEYQDSSRLKQVNLELGSLANKHKACRLNSGIFSILGAMVLAVSVLGLIHLLPAASDDWTQNPNSPVYAIATQEEKVFELKAVLVAIGFATGLTLLYSARAQCSQQRGLWQREKSLRGEMRQLRDKLYVVDKLHAVHEPQPNRHVGQTAPLDPDDARGEYVGVYNPPTSHRDHNPEQD